MTDQEKIEAMTSKRLQVWLGLRGPDNGFDLAAGYLIAIGDITHLQETK